MIATKIALHCLNKAIQNGELSSMSLFNINGICVLITVTVVIIDTFLLFYLFILVRKIFVSIFYGIKETNEYRKKRITAPLVPKPGGYYEK